MTGTPLKHHTASVYSVCTVFPFGEARSKQHILTSESAAEKVDVTKSGNFTWKIDIPDSTLAVDGEYFVTFKAPSSKYSEKANGLPSPGFTILNKQGKLNTTLPTLVNGTLASNSSSSDGPSLSTAAEVGVGIGAGAAAFALIGTAAALFFRNRKKPEGDAEASQAPSRSQSNMGEA